MTTATGVTVFLAIIVAMIGIICWALASAAKRGVKYGRAASTAEEADELLAIAEEKQEAERALEEHIAAHPERRAVDRLRQSKAYRGE